MNRINILLPVFFLVCSAGYFAANAQAPQLINYQAVVRDNTGAILQNHEIGLRFTITNGPEGEQLYQETAHAFTNGYGLITHGIGSGAPVIGSMASISWSDVSAWLVVEMDLSGGTNYVHIGSSQLLSVPYALFAATGNQGPQGAQGIQGIPGTPGAKGDKGDKGDKGEKGDKGDPGAPGTDGQDGLNGSNGTDGTNGAIWYTGSGAPPAANGNIGDLYLNNDNGDYYIKTGVLSWTLQGNLKGPSGSGAGLGDGTSVGNTTFWNGSTWVVNNANLFNDGTNVGVNVAAPQARLHVKGSTNATEMIVEAAAGQTNANPMIRLRNTLGKDLAWISSDDTTNLFIGVRAGLNNSIASSANYNTFIGSNVGLMNTSGYLNTAVGAYSLSGNLTGALNTALGSNALFYNKSGSSNTAVGASSMISNIDGFDNTAIGKFALYQNTSGAHNTAVGSNTLSNTSIASDNTACGYNALYFNGSGHHNAAFGSGSMNFNTAGIENAAMGASTLTMNSSGNYNAAFGAYALNDNTSGSGNTAVGRYALTNNSTANNNTGIGVQALETNITGFDNTGIGAGALRSNTLGNSNTGVGMVSLNKNTIGSSNTAIGLGSLSTNTEGSNNTGLGTSALMANTLGVSNTTVGSGAGAKVTTGSFNTALGMGAMAENTTGDYNTIIGQAAGWTSNNLDNSSALGFDAGGVVNASNRIEIGNTSVSVIAGQVGFSTYSDARIKDNVQADVPGLDFINRLRPVTYNLNIHRENEMTGKTDTPDWNGKYDLEHIRMTGFLAQDVEAAAAASHYDFSGVQKPGSPNELYSLRYSDFVMPLVKSVQEVNAKLESEVKNLKSEISTLSGENEDLKARLERLEKEIFGKN